MKDKYSCSINLIHCYLTVYHSTDEFSALTGHTGTCIVDTPHKRILKMYVTVDMVTFSVRRCL